MKLNLNFSKKFHPWFHCTLKNIFEDSDLRLLLSFFNENIPTRDDITRNYLQFNKKRIENRVDDNYHSCEIGIGHQLYNENDFCRDLVDYCRSPEFINNIEQLKLTWLKEKIFKTGNYYLRIQFIRDIDGYSIKPHPDNRNKLLTFLVFLCDEDNLGTHLFNNDLQCIKKVPSSMNTGFLFFPLRGDVKSYHGFVNTKIKNVRDSIAINIFKGIPNWAENDRECFWPIEL